VLDEIVESVKAMQIAWRALKAAMFAARKSRISASDCRGPTDGAFGLLFTVALGSFAGAQDGARRQMTKRSSDALQFKEIVMSGAERVLQSFQLEAEDARVFSGRYGETVTVIEDAELPRHNRILI